MRAQLTHRDPTAALKVRVIQLQERAATLAREGKIEEARRVRSNLMVLLNQLDVLELAK
jgi:hypothetical protein